MNGKPGAFRNRQIAALDQRLARRRFRKRLRGSKEKSNWQPWISTLIALLALFVSLTTAFFTFFYQSDELEVAVSAGAFRFVDKPEFYAPESMTFINSGTRALTVLSVSQLIVQPTDQVPEPDCQHGYAQRLALNFEPTVVKPNEMVAKAATSFKLPPPMVTKGAMFFNRPQSNDLARTPMSPPQLFSLDAAPKPDPQPYQAVDRSKFAQARGLLFVACMTFELVATNGLRWHKTIEVLRTRGTMPYLTRWVTDYPQYLIRRNGLRTLVDQDPLTNNLVDHD